MKLKVFNHALGQNSYHFVSTSLGSYALASSFCIPGDFSIPEYSFLRNSISYSSLNPLLKVK